MKVLFEQLNDWFNVSLLLLNSGVGGGGGTIHFKTNAREINGKLQYENKFITIYQIQNSRIMPQ